MIKFSPYLPPSQPQIRKILLTFIQNPSLILEVHNEFLKAREDGELGQANNSFTNFLRCCIDRGDKLLESIKDQFPRNLYGACNKAVEDLQEELKVFGELFSDLVALLWITKQKDGEAAFSKNRFNFWDSLINEFPEMNDFFPEETALVPARTDEIRDVRPRRRRKPAGKEDKVKV